MWQCGRGADWRPSIVKSKLESRKQKKHINYFIKETKGKKTYCGVVWASPSLRFSLASNLGPKKDKATH
jgi:hypothetical protein